MGDWSIITPLEGINLLHNPSGELGTTGYGSITGSATLVGSVAGTAVFGIYSARVTPGAPPDAGAFFGTVVTGAGTTYGFSAYVQAAAGSQYQIQIVNGAFGDRVGSVSLTAGGTWHCYRGSFVETTNGTRLLLVNKLSGGAGVTPFHVDAVRIQVGTAVDTYVDGDQDGCEWLGDPHASPSVRSGQTRAGGSITPLNDLGLVVLESPGVGMPTVENIAQPYAQLNGAFYQRTRTAARTFTLVVQASGSTLPGLYALRQRAIDTIKSDLVAPQQPARLLYTGAGGTTQIDALYDGGLERADRDGFAEKIAWRFVSFDPYWQATTDRGTILPALSHTGSINHIAYRDPVGRWGTFGSAVNGTVRAMVEVNTTIYLGGTWTQAGGTASLNLASLRSGTFGTIAAGTVNGAVNAIAPTPDGTTYVLGEFSSVASPTARPSGRLAYLTGGDSAWGTFATGANGPLYGGALDLAGTLHVGGSFTTISSPTDSIAGTHAAYWNKVQWNFLPGAQDLFTSLVSMVKRDAQFRIYFGGQFPGGLQRWNGIAFGGPGGFNNQVNDVLSLPDGRVVFGGAYSTVSSGSARFLSWYTGVQHTGLGTSNSPNGPLQALAYDGTRLFTGGSINAVGSEGASGLAALIYPQWLPRELIANPTPRVWSLLKSNSGTLYAGFDRVSNGTVASFSTIAAPSNAAASPVRVVFRAPATGTARLLHLINATTGGALYFNLSLFANEVATLILAPGSISFTSSLRGNVISSILPVSNPVRWFLAPGNNGVSFFADNSGLRADLIYRTAYWSADSTV